MHKLSEVPSILEGFDPKLTVRERGRLNRHSGTYLDVLLAVAKRNTEREVRMFLYYELTLPHPRESVVDRLCGKLQRMVAQRSRAELLAFAKRPSRGRY